MFYIVTYFSVVYSVGIIAKIWGLPMFIGCRLQICYVWPLWSWVLTLVCAMSKQLECSCSQAISYWGNMSASCWTKATTSWCQGTLAMVRLLAELSPQYVTPCTRSETKHTKDGLYNLLTQSVGTRWNSPTTYWAKRVFVSTQRPQSFINMAAVKHLWRAICQHIYWYQNRNSKQEQHSNAL